MKPYLLSLFFFCSCLQLHAQQDYRYLQILIDTADNFQFRELEWFENGVSYPEAMTAYNTPSPLLVTGDNANWNLFYLYDDDLATQSYVNEVNANPEFTREFTLDLGEGNSLSPDSIRLSKPAWSVLNSFRILLSTDGVNWELYLDTTRAHIWAESLTFPLNLILDTEAPTTPQNLQNPYSTSSQVYLEWLPATDNFRVDQYHIYQDDVLIDSTQTTYFASQNLLANTSYDFQIFALDKARNASIPGWITTVTLSTDEIAPTLSGSIEVIDLTASTATIRWHSAVDQQGLSGYLIKLEELTIGTTHDTVFSICGLDTLTTYRIEVVAKDYSGNLSNALKTSFRTLIDNGRMKLGTNFWNQIWSPENNQLFVNGYQNVMGDNPWKPELLAEINYAQTLRFMEMQQINQGAIIPTYTWLARKKKTEILQDELAYEWMIDLCNRKNANLWVCVPDQIISRNGLVGGRENYLKKLAILIKTGVDMGDINLDQVIFNDLTQFTQYDFIINGGKLVSEPLASHLKIYIEYGNENWNSNFPQTTYCANEGLAMGMGWGPASAGRVFSGYASLQLYEAFAAVFGKDASRIEDILPIQRHGLFYTNYTFTQVFDDPVLNPNNFMPDHISGATYFSNGEDGADENIEQIMLDDISEVMEEARDMRAYLDEAGAARNRYFGLVSYEGGHHITTNFEPLNVNPILYNTYLTFLDSMHVYFEEIVLYSHVARNAFGLKQYVNQPLAEAHKYRAVVEWLPAVLPDSVFCQKEIIVLQEDTIANSLYKANDSIQASGRFPTQSKGTFLATNAITLLPGFEVEAGANFQAEIATCTFSPITTLTNNNDAKKNHIENSSRTSSFGNTQPFETKEALILKISPNPTNQIAQIQFYLPEETGVQISVYNANGQLMTSLQNKVLEGWNRTNLSVHQLPSGIYYVSLQTPNKRLTKKIVVTP